MSRGEGRRYMNRAKPNCNAVPRVDRCNAERQVDEYRLWEMLACRSDAITRSEPSGRPSRLQNVSLTVLGMRPQKSTPRSSKSCRNRQARMLAAGAGFRAPVKPAAATRLDRRSAEGKTPAHARERNWRLR